MGIRTGWGCCGVTTSISCRLHRRFDGRLSSSYQRDELDVSITFGSGEVSGVLSHDAVAVGTLTPMSRHCIRHGCHNSDIHVMQGRCTNVRTVARSHVRLRE